MLSITEWLFPETNPCANHHQKYIAYKSCGLYSDFLAIALQKVLPTDIDLPYRDLLNDDGSLIPVKDGNVYTFLPKKPIAGSSPFVRFSLNFDYDKTKKFENRPYTVRNGQVEYGGDGESKRQRSWKYRTPGGLSKKR